MTSNLWFTDRSRFETGTGRCARQRYLRFHYGPTGYGITRTGESVPLSTGTYFAKGVELLARGLQKTDELPDVQLVREAVRVARAAYETRVTAKGFRGALSSAITDETIKEQSVLLGGLIWAFALRFLPWLHETYRIVECEEERIHLLDCTCGAGSIPTQAIHDERGCAGIALMIRLDIVAQHRRTNHLAYFECKTTGWESDAWAEQWETKPQLGLGTLDLDKKFGNEVTEIYIVGAGKGVRKKDKSGDDPMRRQQSPLCYGYCRPGNPPHAKDEWLPAYEWKNEAGETKRASKAHRRRGVWELEKSDWPIWIAYKSSEPDLQYDEFWFRQLPSSVLDRACFVLGPLNRQDTQIQMLRHSMRAEEERWRDILWQLYEAQQQHAWASPEFQQLLDALIPCSWNCRPFGKEHECEMTSICFRQAGWENPIATSKFIPRRPHHTPETAQAIARGLLVEHAEDLDDDNG
jgi:hypothetical protein